MRRSLGRTLGRHVMLQQALREARGPSQGDAEKLQCEPGEAVVTRNLVCKYEDFTALEGVTIKVHFGEALGIVGPNGSGK